MIDLNVLRAIFPIVHKPAVSHLNIQSFDRKREIFKNGQIPRGPSTSFFFKITYLAVTYLTFQEITRLGSLY